MANQEQTRWEQELRDAARQAEEELQRVVAYVNDKVVPEVREEGSQALRAAARRLEKLAQMLDDKRTEGRGSENPKN